jgi:hypothetical protein
MPTAVERLLDSFLKFDGVREQDALNEAFLKIDDTFLKLSNANADDFLKIEHDRSITIKGGGFEIIGDAFIKVGIDFQKVDTADNLTGNFVVRLLGDHKIGDLLPAVDQDFKFLDHKIDAVSTDLKIVGLDFLKLDSSPNQQVFDHKVQTASSDFLKLGGDTEAASDAFIKLGEAFITVRKAGGDPKLLDAFEQFGGELVTIGQTLDTLAGDFLKLGDALHGTGGGEGDSANTIGGTLTLIYQEFHLLDAEFAKLGGGATELIGLLHPSNGNDGPPTVVGNATQHGGSGHG